MASLLVLLHVPFLCATTAAAPAAHGQAHGSAILGLPPEYIHVLLNPLPIYGTALIGLAAIEQIDER